MYGLMSLDFCCGIQMVGSEFGVNNMMHGSILPLVIGSGRWWGYYCVGGCFLGTLLAP